MWEYNYHDDLGHLILLEGEDSYISYSFWYDFGWWMATIINGNKYESHLMTF